MKARVRLETSLVLFAALLFSSFLRSVAFGEELATVNGTAITSDDFHRRMARFTQEGMSGFDNPEERKELLDLLVSQEVLVQEAKRLGIDKQKEPQEKIRDLTQQVLVSAMVDRIAAEKLTEPAMKSFFETNRGDFRELHAEHILVKTEEEAKDLKKKLDGGADFAELAKKFSTDTGSAGRGGDLGFFNRERMVRAFSDAAFSLKVNEVSGPVKTSFGYHIIRAIEYRDPKGFKELSPQELQGLKSSMMNSEIEKLKQKSKIQEYPDRLQKVQ